MATSPAYYFNSPVSGTVYRVPVGYWFKPTGGCTVHVQAWSGVNGTGSLVTCTTLEAFVRDHTTTSDLNSFTGSSANTTNVTGPSTSDQCGPAGTYTGSGVGSLKMWADYTGTAVVPGVSSFTPTIGGPGTTVTISGSSFSGATGVQFAGTTAAFTVNSDTDITATVPNGATTGTISVSNPSGTGTSSGTFTVSQAYADNGLTFGQGVIIQADNGAAWVTSGVQVWADDGTAWHQIG